MSRTDRLFRLLDTIRRLPAPVTAARLAEETGVSRRTLYRDIETLRAGGALIDGEAGVGYTLTEDPALPPQTFTRMETEALVVGLGFARQEGDAALADAAQTALAKIVATLPERVQRQTVHAIGQTYRFGADPEESPWIGMLRNACWDERAVDLTYRDRAGQETVRRLLPLSLVYHQGGQTLLAWCCLREGFRMFQLRRMIAVSDTDESFRPRRVTLLRAYLAQLYGQTGPITPR